MVVNPNLWKSAHFRRKALEAKLLNPVRTSAGGFRKPTALAKQVNRQVSFNTREGKFVTFLANVVNRPNSRANPRPNTLTLTLFSSL